jgi:hypothetical protein
MYVSVGYSEANRDDKVKYHPSLKSTHYVSSFLLYILGFVMYLDDK